MGVKLTSSMQENRQQDTRVPMNEETIKADARRYRERLIQSLGAKTVPED